MGSFFTNLQIRTTSAERVRDVVAARLHADGLRDAAPGEAADREVLIVPADGGQWVAMFDERAEDQDATIVEWARELSKALETDAFSVLVHDSDVLQLALFASGEERDRYDSNPSFSGRKPSKLKPAARAEKWAHLLAAGQPAKALAAVFSHRGTFAERGLAALATALGIEHASLGTGYRYLTKDGEVPVRAVRIRLAYVRRPAWERRADGPPQFISQWAVHGQEEPATPPVRVRTGDDFRAHAIAVNSGGAARGVRVEIACDGTTAVPRSVEVVVVLPGRLQMKRHGKTLAGTRSRVAAEVPDVELQSGKPAALPPVAGAPMQAVHDVMNAGKVHLNIVGVTTGVGPTTLTITLTPTANPAGAYVERVTIEVTK